jgi:hypothetical protein
MVINKNFRSIRGVVLSLAIMLMILSTSLSVKAYHIASVVTNWDVVQIFIPAEAQYSENYIYKELHFLNSFSYTQSHAVTTKTLDYVLMRVRTTYTRVYRTW